MKPHQGQELPPIEGVRVRGTVSSYVLVNASLIQGVESSHELGGTTEVPRENVYCVERVR